MSTLSIPNHSSTSNNCNRTNNNCYNNYDDSINHNNINNQYINNQHYYINDLKYVNFNKHFHYINFDHLHIYNIWHHCD